MDPVTREHIRRLDALSRQIQTGSGALGSARRAVIRDAIGHIDFQSVEIERLHRRIRAFELDNRCLGIAPERV